LGSKKAASPAPENDLMAGKSKFNQSGYVKAKQEKIENSEAAEQDGPHPQSSESVDRGSADRIGRIIQNMDLISLPIAKD